MSITEASVQTSQLSTHYLDSGGDGQPVIFIHGNASSGEFFRDTLKRLPARLRGLAPDLRGYGKSEAKPVDATRGLDEFAADLHSFIEKLDLAAAGKKVYLAGWSLGGGVVMRYAMQHPQLVAGLILLAPMSPYGFGGTRGISGDPCTADFAGSGGGGASPEFVGRLRKKDRSSDSPQSPRNVINSFYFKPPFRLTAEAEEAAVSALLEMQLGADNYPGDSEASQHWPGIAPGKRGINNALSPKYCNLSAFAAVQPRPKVLWIRGADDQIVSDTSLFDLGFLGQLGAVPAWPGATTFPPQPMVSQMRAVLDAYRQAGGQYQELVFSDCGHSPHLEKADAFHEALEAFVQS